MRPDLFLGGPPLNLQLRLGLLRPGRLHTVRRCILFVAVTWLPLAVLCAVDGRLLPRPDGIAFLADLGVHARYGVAGPLLIAADAMAGLVMSQIALRLHGMCAPHPGDTGRGAHGEWDLHERG